MAKGTRVVDLKFSGRNLTAPPEGYNARSEANVKRWIAALPAPMSAPPDVSSTIVVSGRRIFKTGMCFTLAVKTAAHSAVCICAG